MASKYVRIIPLTLMIQAMTVSAAASCEISGGI